MGIVTLLSESGLRTLLPAAVGAIASWTLRKRGAEFQHAIWRIVLAAMLVLPPLMVLPPIVVLPSSGVMIKAAKTVAAFNASLPVAAVYDGAAPVPKPPASGRAESLPWLLYFALITYTAVAATLLIRIVSAAWRAKRVVSAGTRVSIDLMNELGYPRPEVRE